MPALVDIELHMRAKISYCFLHRSHPLAETPVAQLAVTFFAFGSLFIVVSTWNGFHNVNVTAAQHFDCPIVCSFHDASNGGCPVRKMREPPEVGSP